MAFLRLCTMSLEHAIHVSVGNGFEKKSWLQNSNKNGDDDDDARCVSETNDYFLDKYGDAEVLDDFFSGAVDRSVHRIYVPDGYLVVPEANRIIGLKSIDFIVAHRLTSYTTKTFDLNIFLEGVKDPYVIENIDRNQFNKIREWYPCPIYTWGEDRFDAKKLLHYVREEKIPVQTLFVLLGMYSLSDMDSIIHIKDRDNKTWEDIVKESMEEEDAYSDDDDEWVPGDDDDDDDTEIDEFNDDFDDEDVDPPTKKQKIST